MAIEIIQAPEEISESEPALCYFCESPTRYWNLESLEPVCHICAEKYDQRHLARRCEKCNGFHFRQESELETKIVCGKCGNVLVSQTIAKVKKVQ